MPTASDILGVPVPSDSPAFLLALGSHVAAGITCVVAGAIAALARKRPGLHPRAGLVYVAGLTWVFASSVVMAVLRWPHDLHLLLIGVLAFAAGTFGLVTRVTGGARWQQRHLVAMACSYILLLTGFYVDNGPHLPVWRHLPEWTFWVLPTAIGIPLVRRALRRRA